ncbi:MAG TPA: acyl carrier protein [Thermoanaerobaculia bacterium]|nr:acyl carrier protein [Thermoanaerobaculia bacterium]
MSTATKTTEEIRAAVLSVLGEIAPEADPAAIDPAESLREQLDLDSMDFLNFVIGVHKRLGVEIPEADYPKLASLDGAMAYLKRAG